MKHVQCGQGSLHESQFTKIISSTMKILASNERGTLTTSLSFLCTLLANPRLFFALMNVYIHTAGAGCHCPRLMRLQFTIRCCLLAIVSVAFAPFAYPICTRYPRHACAYKFALDLIEIPLANVLSLTFKVGLPPAMQGSHLTGSQLTSSCQRNSLNKNCQNKN